MNIWDVAKETIEIGRQKCRFLIALLVVGSFCYVATTEKALDALLTVTMVVINWYFMDRQMTEMRNGLRTGSGQAI